MGIPKKQLKMQNLTHFLRYGDALYISYIISANVEFSAYLPLIVKIIGNIPKYLYKTLYLWSKPTNLIWKLVLLLLCRDTEILQSRLSNFCSVNKKKIEKNKYCPQFGLNQKILLYKLKLLTSLTTCIEGIFYLGQIADSIFFFRIKKFATSFENFPRHGIKNVF